MNKMISELDRNEAEVGGYIDRLKSVLAELYDAEVWETSEWDWQWPEHVAPDIHTAQLVAAASGLPLPIVELLRAMYATYGRAPALDGWAAQWNGSETLFLRFMHDKLEEYRADAHTRFRAARQMLLQLQ